jgi:hypothetical protein
MKTASSYIMVSLDETLQPHEVHDYICIPLDFLHNPLLYIEELLHQSNDLISHSIARLKPVTISPVGVHNVQSSLLLVMNDVSLDSRPALSKRPKPNLMSNDP